MRILVCGLPGSGKTTLSDELGEALFDEGHTPIHINADVVRKTFDDWDFSDEGRKRQATRMHTLSVYANQWGGTHVISDFVAPTPEIRAQFNADFVIWMDTIQEGRFEDTNKAWVPLTDDEYDVRVTDFNDLATEVENICQQITRQE